MLFSFNVIGLSANTAATAVWEFVTLKVLMADEITSPPYKDTNSWTKLPITTKYILKEREQESQILTEHNTL